MIPHLAQKGYLMIVAAALLVVIAFFAVAMGSLISGNVSSGASHLGSMQALYQSESGLEFEQRRWAQNLDWYRSATDPNPNPATPQSLATGSFSVNTNLPATLLKTGLGAVAASITAYTTDRFPAGGILQIGEDLTLGAEFVRYTGISGNTFTGATRGVTVGTLASTAAAHARGDTVYPVTTLVDALTASCVAPSSFRIVSHSKFLGAGTLDIEGEEIGYSGSTVTGGNMTLTGVQRCSGLLGPVAHAIGQPVTPVLANGDSASYQAEIASTGMMGSNIRYARKTIQR